MTGEAKVKTWYLAICRDCRPIAVNPFSVESERDNWTELHAAATLHEVWRVIHREDVG